MSSNTASICIRTDQPLNQPVQVFSVATAQRLPSAIVFDFASFVQSCMRIPQGYKRHTGQPRLHKHRLATMGKPRRRAPRDRSEDGGGNSASGREDSSLTGAVYLRKWCVCTLCKSEPDQVAQFFAGERWLRSPVTMRDGVPCFNRVATHTRGGSMKETQRLCEENTLLLLSCAKALRYAHRPTGVVPIQSALLL